MVSRNLQLRAQKPFYTAAALNCFAKRNIVPSVLPAAGSFLVEDFRMQQSTTSIDFLLQLAEFVRSFLINVVVEPVRIEKVRYAAPR